ncbi:leucine-rich_repeat domain-containing protein [Hexamita inflata]|uniref:Leucine-rich repeat domain-containing protein n=1 Tax=Hexamita inflata TaxID=28002 RepID=A0AA86QH60_9EUKA|nr:leucine-rich repeat domain-containing protein [Hexamita inflata]
MQTKHSDLRMVQKYFNKISGQKLKIFQDSNVKSFQFVQNLKINELELQNCSQVSFTNPPTNITVLQITHCKLSLLNGIKYMNVIELDLSQNEITDFSELKHLKDLKRVNIATNDATNLRFVSQLKHIEQLIAFNNMITDITGIQMLFALKTLNLSCNMIIDLSPLEKLVQIETLQLGQNKIVDIEAIRDLTNIQKLSIQFNQINDFSPLQNHVNKEKYGILQQYNPKQTSITTSKILKQIYHSEQRVEEMYIKTHCFNNKYQRVKGFIYILNSQIVVLNTQFINKIVLEFKQLQQFNENCQ